MSLDITLIDEDGSAVFDANITHNLTEMAAKAGMYDAIWRPDEIHIMRAAGVWGEIHENFADFLTRPDYFRQFNPKNGWGSYDDFCNWLIDYLRACRQYPNAKIEAHR